MTPNEFSSPYKEAGIDSGRKKSKKKKFSISLPTEKECIRLRSTRRKNLFNDPE